MYISTAELVALTSLRPEKTITVPIATLFAAWNDKRKRARWLADPNFVIRTATANRSMRITWIDGKTSVEVGFFDKGTGKQVGAVDIPQINSAVPMTFLHQGKQYIVFASGAGDCTKLIAMTLPGK